MKKLIFMLFMIVNITLLFSTTHNSGIINYNNLDARIDTNQFLELIGRAYYGKTNAINVVDTFAYACSGRSILVFNISNDSLPYLKSIYDLPGKALNITVKNNYAYIANDSFGLRILNISSPDSLYEVGFINTNGSVKDLCIVGEYVFLACGLYGVMSINVQDPSNPIFIDDFTTAGECKSVNISDSMLYTTINDDLYAKRILSDGKFTYGGFYYSTSGEAQDVFVHNKIAYLADGTEGLKILDVADEQNVFEINSLSSKDVNRVEIFNDSLFLSYGINGIGIDDISDPYSIWPISHNIAFDEILNTYKSGNNLYCADGAGGIKIYDYRNKIELSNYRTFYGSNIFAISDDIICMNTELSISSKLGLLDIANINNPSHITDFTGTPSEIVKNNNYLYLASGTVGLIIKDITDPNNPMTVQTINTPGSANGIYLDSQYLYLADGSSILIYDISVPDAPIFLNDYSTSSAYDVYVTNGIAYISKGTSGFEICDVSDPLNPYFISLYDTPGVVSEIIVQDSFAYISDKFSFKIFNVSQPDSSYEVSSFNAEYNIQSIDVSNHYAYIAESHNGLKILNIQDKKNPVEKTSYKNVEAEVVEVNDSIIYLGTYSSGLYFFKNSFYFINLISPLKGSEVKESTVVYSGDYIEGIKEFEIEYSDDSLFNNSHIMHSSDTIAELPISEDEYYWRVRIIGNDNSINDWSEVWSFVFNITPSKFNVIYPEGRVEDTLPEFIWHSSDDTNLMEYRIYVNDSLYKSLIDTFFVPDISLEQNSYTWYVEAIDSTGNIVRSDSIFEFFIDSELPSKVDLIAPSDSSLNEGADFIWHKSTDEFPGIDYYELSIYGDSTEFVDTFSTNDTMLIGASPSDDIYHWQVRATDLYGNYAQWSDLWTFTLDNYPPISFKLLSPFGYTNNQSPELVFQSTEDLTFRKYEVILFDEYSADSIIDSNTLILDTTYNITDTLQEGQYYWEVTAYDEAGHSTQGYTIFGQGKGFTVDITPPHIVDLNYPGNNTNVNKDTLKWDMTIDSLAGVERYTLNYSTDSIFEDDSIIQTTQLESHAALTDGYYWWRVNAVDSAGNTGEWSDIWTFYYDNTNPDSFSVILPNTYISIFKPDFIFNKSYDYKFDKYDVYINDSLYSINYGLNDTTYTTTIDLSVGMNFWYVNAIDSAGNSTRSTKIDTFYIDTTKPTASSLIAPSNGDYVNSINLLWSSATDNYPGAYYKLWVIDETGTNIDTTIFITDTMIDLSLPDYVYYWKVQAVDSAGNISPWSNVWSFEKDATSPEKPTIIYPLANDTVINDSTFQFRWGTVSKKIETTKQYDIRQKDGIQDKSAPVYYEIAISSDSLFSDTIKSDTTYFDTITYTLNQSEYYWKVRGIDETGNTGSWTNPTFFRVDMQYPIMTMSRTSYDYGYREINEIKTYSALWIFNEGDDDLNIDSTSYTKDEFYDSDTSYTYPLTVLPGDSMEFMVSFEPTDTGYYHDSLFFYFIDLNPQIDTFYLNAYSGYPTIIDSAIADDGEISGSGVDADDYVVLYFNQKNNTPFIDETNIDNVLLLSSGHTWLDGFGNIDSTHWADSGRTMTIHLSAVFGAPTVTEYDTIYPDSATIIGDLNSYRCYKPVIIGGDFMGNTKINECYLTYLIESNNLIITVNGLDINNYVRLDIERKERIINEYKKIGSLYGDETTYKDNTADIYKPGIYRVKGVKSDGEAIILSMLIYPGTTYLPDFEMKGFNSIFTGDYHFIVKNRNSGELKITVYDITGKCIIKKTENIETGMHNLELNMDECPSGVYMIQSELNGVTHKEKITKIQ